MISQTINGKEFEIGPHANLVRANLYGANLYGANLSNADLCGADLSGANLSNADLYGTVLDPALLTNGSLRRAKEWGFEVVDEAAEIVRGWRTKGQPYMHGPDYKIGGWYEPPVFSICAVTECHPGLYVQTTREPGNISVIFDANCLHHAGNKFRVRRFVVEANEPRRDERWRNDGFKQTKCAQFAVMNLRF